MTRPRVKALLGQRTLVEAKICLGVDSHQAILFDDQYAVELVLSHHPAGLMDVLVGPYRHEIL